MATDADADTDVTECLLSVDKDGLYGKMSMVSSSSYVARSSAQS